MDLRVFTEPQQGATYETLLRVAKAAEDLNYGAFFRSDHYLHMGSTDGLPGPTDAWLTLAGLAIVTGLWNTPAGEHFNFNGRFYQLKDCPALPKPAQHKVPVLIGGHGAKRTPALAAQYADEFNIPFASLADTEQQFKRVRAAA